MQKKTLMLILTVVMAIPLAAQVSYVVPPGTREASPSDAPYGSWETAATDIQTAIDAAVAQGWTNVWVSNGTYYLEQQIEIKDPMTLRSWKDGELDREGTIVDGNYPAKEIRCFCLEHAEVVVRGFTIRNAFNSKTGTHGRGGGVFLNNATVDNCLIISNRAAGGGGVCVSAGMLANCTVATNIGTYGGGVHLLSDQSKAYNCIISNNHAATGGGLYVNEGGTASNCFILNNYATSTSGGAILYNGLLVDSIIRGNSASDYAGGVALSESEKGVIMRRCVITENTSLRTTRALPCKGGGGVLVSQGTLAEDCIISNNVAMGAGGGLAACGGIVRRCLITDNDSGVAGQTTTGDGGGCFIGSTPDCRVLLDTCQILCNRANTSHGGGIIMGSTSVLELRNCLVAGNTALANAGGIYAHQGILELDNCTITDNHVEDSTSTTAAGGFYSGYTNHCRNTIIYGNTIAGSSVRSNLYLNSSATISTFTNCCVAPLQTGAKVINEGSFADDPHLTVNYQLLPDSLCINAGVYLEAWMDDAKDIAGHNRLDRFSLIPDIGCFEYMPSGSMFRLR